MGKLGLIAGSGKFPILIAEAARCEGWEVVVYAVKGEAVESDFNGLAAKVYTIPVERVGDLIDKMHEQKIVDAVMAGKVKKIVMFGKLDPDARTLKMLASLSNKADDTLLGAITRELESEGIKLHPTSICVKQLLAEEGVLGKIQPTQEQWKDIRFGWKIAKEIGKIDIGQTVVVRDCAVMAVEAIEGTDETILRGGRLANGNAVVIKVAKPQQDTRFDMPVAGVKTLESMRAVGAKLLAVEAGWTLLAEREKMIELADECGISIVACADPCKETKN